MPTILGPRFGPGFSGYPARMSPEDLEIWRRWYPLWRRDAIALYFDVGLGLPDDLPVSDDPDQLLGWIRNTQKRADVLIERPAHVDLVELRFNASANAVGRLLTYKQLLEDDNPFRKPIVSVLVTNRADREVERVAKSVGFLFFVA